MSRGKKGKGLYESLKAVMISGFIMLIILSFVMAYYIRRFLLLKKMEHLGYYETVKTSYLGKSKGARAIMRASYSKKH